MTLLKQPLEPLKQRLTSSLIWGIPIGIVFFVCYPLTNWLTSQRTDTWGLYFRQELNIPFIAEFIWFYLSLYLLLILPIFLLNSATIKTLAKKLILSTLLACILFIILPCHLGFERVLPTQPNYQVIFNFLFSIDHPHNLVPSLHVIYASLIIFAINKNAKPVLQLLLYSWLVAIISSTLLIHQHHLLDIISSLGLSLIIDKIKGLGRDEKSNCYTSSIS